MSLYEATAHLFYGVRIQRTGRDADTTLPLGPEVDTHDGVEERLKALGHTLPDWRGLLNSKDPNDKEADAKVTVMLRECQALIEAAQAADYPASGSHGRNHDGQLYALGGVSATGFGVCRQRCGPFASRCTGTSACRLHAGHCAETSPVSAGFEAVTPSG
mgnify:CR=1 FL=1